MVKKLILSNNPLLSGPGLTERDQLGIPYREIPVSAIDRDPNQPRVNFDEERLNELASSIKTYGVLSPILVGPAKTAGRYRLIAGERRVRAAKLAGLVTIPAIVSHEDDDTGERTLAVQLVENLQRDELTPLERAHAMAALKEAHGMSVRQVAERLGVSKSMVQRSIDILDLPDDLLNALRQGAPESKILLLAKIEDRELRAKYLRDLDSLTRDGLKEKVAPSPSVKAKGGRAESELNPEDLRITDEIQRALGLKVKMSRPSSDSDNGRLTIEFYSNEDLQELFRKLVAGSY